MDYVDWILAVLSKLVELSRDFSQSGIHDTHIAKLLLEGTYQRHTTYRVFEELIYLGLVEEKQTGWVLPTQAGRDLVYDPLPYWQNVCTIRLDEKQEAVLRYCNSISQKIEATHSWLQRVDSQEIQSVQGVNDNKQSFYAVAKELQEIGLLKMLENGNLDFTFWSTYKGLVWEQRRAFTFESRFIDQLVEEWETTSVDFKRELYLDNENQKAEFVKDILSLANTQASGRRWIIIGFDDKTRSFYESPDARIKQDRMEMILANHTSPVVEIRYEVVGYRSGKVGKIEVLREAKKLPYKVASPVGNKKSISVGQMFVRHGSQVEEPTDLERDSIIEEGERARMAALQAT